jgi:hypothetical protein
MKSSGAHWGSRQWRQNTDDLVPDPGRPRAFPSTYPMDLMGRIRVRLDAEDGSLVAYGFGGQRVALRRLAASSAAAASIPVPGWPRRTSASCSWSSR